MLKIENEERDKEYLGRPKIEGAIFKIDKNCVVVTTPQTHYVRDRRVERKTKEAVLGRYKAVYRAAKKEGINIAYRNHYKRTIDGEWGRYRVEYKEYTELFDKMVEGYKQVEKRGLHIGTVDDEVLGRAVKLTAKVQGYYYRDKAMSIIEEIDYALGVWMDKIEKGLIVKGSTIYL